MATNEIPTLERKESAQPMSTPQYSKAVPQLHSQPDLLGTIGARVAQDASQALATQLGTEAGNNPHGTLLPSLTEFDKHFAASYSTQAGAVLSLQANKLLNDAEIQLGSASRLTPELMKQANMQVATGLAKIASAAPNTIKPELQSSFANTMLSMNQKYQLKMISEQKEEAKQQIIASMNQQVKNIYEIGTSGNIEGADKGAKDLEKMAHAAVAAKQITPEMADNLIDSANKSAKSSKYINEALKARAEGKYEEFIGKFAKSKPSDLSQEQWEYVGSALSNRIGLLNNLRAQDEALRTSNFQLSMIKDVQGITGAQIQEYKESVSPQTFATTMIAYEKALKKNTNNANSIDQATANFSNADTFHNSSDKALIGSLDRQAKALADKNRIPLPQAEMQVAATAAGPIKGYITRLDTKAQSGNPALMNEAMAARDYIAQSNHPQNVLGLKDESAAMLNMYQAMKANHDEPTAAQMAQEAVMNADPQKQKALDESYANYVKNKKRSGETEAQFALRVADIDKNSFVNVPQLSEYVREKFSGYYRLNNGNVDLATKQLKQDINQTFDYDTTNGIKQYNLFPIKKFYNLPENSNGFIHEDMKEQVDGQLKETKDLYDQGHFDYYWELKPQVSFEEMNHALDKVQERWNPKPNQYKDSKELAKAHAEFERDKKIYQGRIDEFKQGKPPTAIQHWRSGHIEEFILEVRASRNMAKNPEGNVNGFYEVNLQNKTGTKSFILANPNQNTIRYRPNRNRIVQNYMKLYPIIEQTFGPKEIVGANLMMLGR